MIRLFDIFFVVIALTFLSPLLVICIIILKFTGEGEVFYLQDRIGENQKLFKIIKFATMLKNSPNLLSKNITLKNDQRVLPIGKFLRKFKINELPQLINILKGEMSIVGPRPLTPDNYSLYSDYGKEKISKLKPGLSGIGSIFFMSEEDFFVDNDNHQEVYKKKIIPIKESLEIWYFKNRSVYNYFKVIFLTVFFFFINKKSRFQILRFFYKNLHKEVKFFNDGL